MANTDELHARLLDGARRCDPAVHHRSVLAPYRDVVLIWRAKHMSYEKISAVLAQNGLKVSPATVGVFCRNHLTKAETERVRREQSLQPSLSSPVQPRSPTKPVTIPSGARGPRIARDDY
jgi:hypothetical protein